MFVGIDFKSVPIAARAVLVVAARAGRETVTPVDARVFLRSNARDVSLRVPVRARVEFTRGAVVRAETRGVALRVTTDVSRDVVVSDKFVRDNESDPRTAAADAPMESAVATIEIISFFISV